MSDSLFHLLTQWLPQPPVVINDATFDQIQQLHARYRMTLACLGVYPGNLHKVSTQKVQDTHFHKEAFQPTDAKTFIPTLVELYDYLECK